MNQALHYDTLETRSADERQAGQLATLRAVLTAARDKAPGFAERLEGVDLEALNDAAALSKLPLLRKASLSEQQAAAPPFAGLTTVTAGQAAHLFASPGPIYELEGQPSDYGRMARALYAAGVRPGDVVHNCFAYHLTPGGWIMDAGARALGCAVIPAGVGQSEQQIEAIAHLKPGVYTGTPDYLKTLLDKGQELGRDVSSIDRALVSGGALFPKMRKDYGERGVAVLQCYATAEAGLIAYESRAPGDERGEALPGMITDEGVIVEIVRPGTGDPVAAGEVGEVVVTTLNPVYPLLRLATGDLSKLLAGGSACGRTAPRIAGWMGRADQTTKVKGMFVHPEQVAQVVSRHAEIVRARLKVERADDADVMTLACEVQAQPEGLAERIADSLREVCKLRGGVELVAVGSLSNDGKVIDDLRDFSA
ncbi:MAG: AMP-binding protein [Myxococcales bacterium]|nr:AMP-binding protein [Myxococcales bacterium]